MNIPVQTILFVLKESFYLYIRNFWYIVVITLTATWPAFLFSLYWHPHVHGHGSSWQDMVNSVSMLLIASFCQSAQAGALFHVLEQRAKNEAITIRGLFFTLRTYLLILFAANVYITVAVFFGVLLLVLPGWYLFTKYFLTLPLIVGERLGRKEAIKRSFDLVRGRNFVLVFASTFFLLLGLLGLFWFSLRGVGSDHGGMGFRFCSQIVNDTLDALFPVLSWCLYKHVVELEPVPWQPLKPELDELHR